MDAPAGGQVAVGPGGGRPRRGRGRRGSVSIEYIALGTIVAAGMAVGGQYVRDHGATIGKAVVRPFEQVADPGGG